MPTLRYELEEQQYELLRQYKVSQEYEWEENKLILIP